MLPASSLFLPFHVCSLSSLAIWSFEQLCSVERGVTMRGEGTGRKMSFISLGPEGSHQL